MPNDKKRKKRDCETYRDREFHVYLTDEEHKMLDVCSDALVETKSALVREFIRQLYVSCIGSDNLK
jgi:hypothetical protein